jgi:hypothetical protein
VWKEIIFKRQNLYLTVDIAPVKSEVVTLESSGDIMDATQFLQSMILLPGSPTPTPPPLHGDSGEKLVQPAKKRTRTHGPGLLQKRFCDII